MPEADPPYAWCLSARARRDLDALSEGVAAAMIEFITDVIVRNPQRLGGPLGDHWDGYLSARRGEYRVIYSIDEAEHLISVARVWHRGKVYGR